MYLCVYVKYDMKKWRILYKFRNSDILLCSSLDNGEGDELDRRLGLCVTTVVFDCLFAPSGNSRVRYLRCALYPHHHRTYERTDGHVLVGIMYQRTIYVDGKGRSFFLTYVIMTGSNRSGWT